VDERLLDAQDAGDAVALRAALADGGNPNLLAPNGSSMLMLAAHRGQLEHVEALLAAGAQPDMRQTQKDSERGDTALLRAFYGGHLAVAQRLVQAGASLGVRNRWDWGPVHMAALSGCVVCLEWLAAQGQRVDEPAASSRGETPTMLAASRGRIEALQWFEARGIDLSGKDSHGKTALDWARFKQQAHAERWLQEHTR
jgi:ankyrin repeat protein